MILFSPFLFHSSNWSALCKSICMANAERFNYYFYWFAFSEYHFCFISKTFICKNPVFVKFSKLILSNL